GCPLTTVADPGVRDDSFVFLLIMLEIGTDSPWPVDLVVTRAAVASSSVERTVDRFAHGVLESAHQVVDNSGHHAASGLLRLGRDDTPQGEEGGDEMDVGFDGFEEFGLGEQLVQLESLERVALHYLN